MSLGAGRERKEDQVDHAVGVVCRAKRGDRAERGEPLAEVHARDEATAEMAVAALLSAYEIGEEPEPRPLVLEVIH
jgi:thymidine phosphorylase